MKSIIIEKRNVKEKKELFDKYQITNDELLNTKELLQSTRNDLLKTKNLLEESVVLTEIISSVIGEIPKESDFSFVTNLGEREEIIPISSKTGQSIKMYGGDEFEYHIFGESRWFDDRYDIWIYGLYLEVGNRTYPLFRFNDKIRVAAPIGLPMEIKLIWDKDAKNMFEYLVSQYDPYFRYGLYHSVGVADREIRHRLDFELKKASMKII